MAERVAAETAAQQAADNVNRASEARGLLQVQEQAIAMELTKLHEEKVRLASASAELVAAQHQHRLSQSIGSARVQSQHTAVAEDAAGDSISPHYHTVALFAASAEQAEVIALRLPSLPNGSGIIRMHLKSCQGLLPADGERRTVPPFQCLTVCEIAYIMYTGGTCV